MRRPSKRVMTSPISSDEASAGLPSRMLVTSAPWAVRMPKDSARSAVTSWMITPQPAAAHLAGAPYLIGDVHRHLDRDREGQAHEAARAAVDLAVDADHVAVEVEQRPAGVPRVDGHVGLDERHVAFVGQRAPGRADDARGDREVEAEGRADGQHPLADVQRLGVADRDGGQVRAVDLEHRHVRARVGADDLGDELAAVVEPHHDLVGVGHDVVVGQDVAVVRDHEAGAERARGRRVRGPLALAVAPDELVDGLPSSPGTPASGPSPSGPAREALRVLMFTTARWFFSTRDVKSGSP